MRILLVEDDLKLSRIIETILKQNNYTVDVVFDGMTALDYLSSSIYDGVILDMMLPKLDGIGVLKTMRANKNTVPVLILSAKSEIDDKVEGLDAGANDYLTKPFDRKELLARLRVLTRNTGMQNDATLHVGNVTLNIASCTVSTPSGSYELVGKEFQILQLFMREYNTIISAEQIMDKIWDVDSDSTLKTVWTYISYIRRKLEALDADITIATRRNLGYIMEKKS